MALALYTGSNGNDCLTFWNILTSYTTVTHTMWVKPTAVGSYHGFIICRDLGFEGMLLSGAASNPLTYTHEGTGDEWNAATGLFLVLNQWNFIATTVGPTAATVYLATSRGATLQSWTNTKTHNAKSSTSWFLGKDTTAGRNVQGSVSEYCCWNAKLTSGEILALSKGVSARLIRPSDMKIYLPLINNNIDLIGNSSFMTYNGDLPQWRYPGPALAYGDQ